MHRGKVVVGLVPVAVRRDERRRPGGPPRVGDVVRLWLDLVTGPNESRGELVALEVTADLGGGRYRGELVERPDPSFLPPAAVRLGQPFEFTAADVSRVEDGPPAAEPNS